MLQRLTTALADRYRVERELGEGGMAVVFLAHDLKHHRPVAIKVLKPEIAAALGAERFLREIEIAAGLQHPHILPVFDSGQVEGQAGGQPLLYYVMPFVDGESLAARISREGGLPVDWSVRILREVADALAYAHGRGLVHRDIKPDNILLSGNHALVADFGIARAVRDAAGGTALTGTGISLGTPAYMAPEQAAGEAVDHRADIYALGIVAYEMLAGEPPFRGRTAQAVIGAHLSLPPASITQHRPGLSPALAATVMKCLEKHPADRFQSSEELLSSLEMAVGAVTTVASHPTASTASTASTATTAQRTALIFAAVSVTVLALTYGLMIAVGLPSWVFPAAVALLLIGLPIIFTTQRVEQNRTPSAAPHKVFNWKRAITGGVLAFGVLGLVVGGYMTMRALGIGPVGTLVASGRLKEHPRVILADFTDNTGDSTLATAVTDAFRVDLGQSGAVDLVQGAAIKDAFTRMKKEAPRSLSEELAREVASREGIPAIVTGEINAIGGGYVISARILDAEGNVLVPLRETASDSSKIIPAVDKLSRKVRERIGESLRDIRETPALEQVTTASLPALRKYTQGMRAIEAGELDQGVALFKEAIALDSTFAGAYRGLATALGNLDVDRALMADAWQKAFRLRDRLTERERLWTEGSYYLNVSRPDQARAAYLELLGKEPDSARVLNNLGIVDLNDRKPEQALAWYERALAFQPRLPQANFNVVAASVDLGRVDRARAVRVQFDSIRPGHIMGTGLRWIIGWGTADYALVDTAIAQVMTRGLSSMETIAVNGRLWLAGLRGQPSRMNSLLSESERRAGEGREIPEYLRALVWAATYQAVVQGRSEDAIARMDAALARYPLASLQPADRPYAELAQFYARANRPARARQLLADFRREASQEMDAEARRSLGLATAHATLAEGKPQEAIREFEAADVGQCKVCTLPGLAAAWQAAGNQDSVLAVLERYVTLPDDDRHAVDPLERPGAFARLGELYEAKGDAARAVGWNAKFLELWKDADAEFKPVIDRVRERQRKLTAER